MAELFNIYCDESCHLENDRIPIMALGAVWCPAAKVREISVRIREIKQQHGLLSADELRQAGAAPFEIKWSKVSASKVPFYLALVDFFFDDDDLHFRGVVIDKTGLDHSRFRQTHDEWYYKMLFTLLEPIIDPQEEYRIYLDIKDTRSEQKRSKLEQVLRNSRRDWQGEIVTRIQQIRSHESEILQMTDLLLGAVTYHNRVRTGCLPPPGGVLNQGKLRLIDRIRVRSGKTLEHTTWLREAKFNLFRWEPGEGGA